MSTPASEALLHLKNAAAWLSAAAETQDPLLNEYATQATTLAANVEKHLTATQAPRVVTIAAGVTRIMWS